MSTDITTGRPGIYSMGQLSVKPSQVAIPENLVIAGTYGRGEQEAMAALLIVMCRESGDVWQGFTLGTIGDRVIQEHDKANTDNGGGFLFTLNHQAAENLNKGLPELIERGMLQVEPDAGTDRSLDVVFPTEKLLEPIQRLIRA